MTDRPQVDGETAGASTRGDQNPEIGLPHGPRSLLHARKTKLREKSYGPVNEVLHGDCLDLVSESRCFDFVLFDPPELSPHVKRCFAACWRACRGIFVAIGGPERVDTYLAISRSRRMHRIAWIVWDHGAASPSSSASGWRRSHSHIVVFARNAAHPCDSAATVGSTPLGRKVIPGDLWGPKHDGRCWGQISKNSYERWGVGGQLPELLVQRLLIAYTTERDLILDPFAGSGTLHVVARSLKRNSLSIELDAKNIEIIKRRGELGTVRLAPT